MANNVVIDLGFFVLLLILLHVWLHPKADSTVSRRWLLVATLFPSGREFPFLEPEAKLFSCLIDSHWLRLTHPWPDSWPTWRNHHDYYRSHLHLLHMVWREFRTGHFTVALDIFTLLSERYKMSIDPQSGGLLNGHLISHYNLLGEHRVSFRTETL